MSSPCEAEDVKLISSIFSPHKELIDRVIGELEQTVGLTLHRRFISFESLIRPRDIVEIKRTTNRIENGYLQDGKRQVNIDPGYISLERLVLATGKNYIHRIYLSKGIFADLTLIFHKGSFSPLQWTYKDYASPEIIAFFNDVRDRYKGQLRGIENE
jgi:hypothetical protein